MKDTFTEKEREIPVIADVDVLVCGGGPAGVGAAIRAARLGVSVMVVEMLDCLGGMATSGMMSHYTGDSSSSVMREIFIRTRENATSSVMTTAICTAILRLSTTKRKK